MLSIWYENPVKGLFNPQRRGHNSQVENHCTRESCILCLAKESPSPLLLCFCQSLSLQEPLAPGGQVKHQKASLLCKTEHNGYIKSKHWSCYRQTITSRNRHRHQPSCADCSRKETRHYFCLALWTSGKALYTEWERAEQLGRLPGEGRFPKSRDPLSDPGNYGVSRKDFC